LNISLNHLVFFGIAMVTLLGALGVVISRNIIHSALFLILTFLGVAGVFLELNAWFLALVQILVYAGAISVLVIFAIMLVMNSRASGTNPPNPSKGTHLWGIYLAGLLVVSLAGSIWYSRLPALPGPAVPDALGLLADLMLGKYVVAFEAAAILLLLTVVGAIILARGAEEK
jgi:NADH-quinone oxidoreductase subunit J